MHIKVRVGQAATHRFHELAKEETLPALFKAFFDLYLEGVTVQARLIFKELVEIGRANENRLVIPYLEWAEAQVKHLIRSDTHHINIWVRDVCDKLCKSPEDFQAWSQNLGHEKVLTTFTSYGAVARDRQGEILRDLATPQQPAQSGTNEIVEALFQKFRNSGLDVRVT